MWYSIEPTTPIITPSLLFYPDRIQDNIKKMIAIAGGADGLRPHVKTYKCREVVQMQIAAGIQKFKCATLAEAQMLAEIGGLDILVAYPLVGAAQKGFLALQAEYTDSRFSVLVDHREQLAHWQSLLDPEDQLAVFIDINVGMDRTGVVPKYTLELYQQFPEQIVLKGLHIYDGHIHQTNLREREESINEALQPLQKVLPLIQEDNDLELIYGGSISFPIHAQHPERTLSPGTTLLWDRGYQQQCPDLNFDIAALLVTRVVSKPKAGFLCLDLGYKAVAAEMKGAPVYLPQLPTAAIVMHSEEHLVVSSVEAGKWAIGDILYVMPWHICPTVALYDKATIVKDQQIVDEWAIPARQRYS